MDPLSLLPAGGVGTTLAVIIIYLMRQNSSLMKQNAADRAQYMADVASVRVEIAGLKEANAKVLLELDAERRKRWAAEDAAADARRQAGIITERKP